MNLLACFIRYFQIKVNKNVVFKSLKILFSLKLRKKQSNCKTFFWFSVGCLKIYFLNLVKFVFLDRKQKI
ncbi:hypothetical protein CGEO_0092 [Campylobacter geochelonis]|nr:hypothetical protein CGEO_0092 [Campylobacter geochelonis]